MESDSLHSEKKLDQFEHESPIRAFTDWNVSGQYAIGKGFRPSLAHISTYLDAMEVKEGWRLLQILESESQRPSFVFRKLGVRWNACQPAVPPSAYTLTGHPATPDALRDRMSAWKAGRDMAGVVERQVEGKPLGPVRSVKYIRVPDHDSPAGYRNEPVTELGVPCESWCDDPGCHVSDVPHSHEPQEDDPVNPKHYDGTACAEIGERLTGNSYQVLKYNWRLGKKDGICQEIDKSLWYLRREIELAFQGLPLGWGAALPPDDWFAERLKDQDSYVRMVARKLIDWNRHGDVTSLAHLQKIIGSHREAFDCLEFGRGLEP